MCCQQNASGSAGDQLQVQKEDRNYYNNAASWLIYQAVKGLNGGGREDEAGYHYSIEILSRQRSSEAIIQLLRTVEPSDTDLKWSLLHILGDSGDANAVKWLTHYTLEPLPERGKGCEGPRDTELLLRTMAVESLQKIGERHPETTDALLETIRAQPDRAVLIEAVKAAVSLGQKDKVAEILPKEHHWILDIRKARAEELHADPERTDTKGRCFTPPKLQQEFTSPSLNCGQQKGGYQHG